MIHVSQIADYRVAAPGDVLSVGDVMDVKIMDIIEEKNQVALSIRELINDLADADYGDDSVDADYDDADGEESGDDA